MTNPERRVVLKMLGAATLVPSAAIAGVGAPVAAPLLPPLEPLSPELVAILHKGIQRHLAYADEPRLPMYIRGVYQHMVGMRECQLAFPHADAVARLLRLAERYPLLKPNIDGVIAARIDGCPEWEWGYEKVRVDPIAKGGPWWKMMRATS